MLKLDDAELDIVMAACRPLDPHRRDAFMVEVAAELARYPELGPGVVHRVCATVQRRHYDFPDLSHGDYSKHR
jgi:hypothetical protein